MYLMTQPTTKLDLFYLELRKTLVDCGIARVKLANIPFGLNNRKMGELKEMLVADFGNKFCIEKNSKAGILVVDTTRAPAPSRKCHKPAYVNNSGR